MTSVAASAPYLVTYMKNGEKVTLRRRPPPQLHQYLPTDKVILREKKNDDYRAGDLFTVKYFSKRSPNVLQIEDDKGNSTFVSHYDLELKERTVSTVNPEDMSAPENNEYLTWP